MVKNWRLQEAKNQSSIVVEKALTDGYQIVTRHGQPAVVVMPVEEFLKLKPRARPLSRFLADSPLRDFVELSPRTLLGMSFWCLLSWMFLFPTHFSQLRTRGTTS